jgi:hypothetical protein
VELVEDLSAVEPEHVDVPEPETVAIQFAEICGFLDLDEGRGVRDQLHHAGITSELVIRVAPGSPVDGPAAEEYWLRADARQIREVKALLDGSPPAESDSAPPEGFKCSQCKRPVREEETFCANCGMRFSE